jgi:hypothetical protein
MPYLILIRINQKFSKAYYSIELRLKMTLEDNIMNNNCLCHIFDDNNCTWIIILAIVIVFCCCCNH